ncbi:ABC transporter permease [Pareuzebyella sediminis]|uniref:ABC transporter permease n=1 Tax=Pareuzebyella sediminis TaxID=2607998 RepID=UPI0018E0FC93|nr:ABC transporter permease [Pareuzebyella sediminis]
MLLNNIKIAFRNLGKRKGFALINIVGLSLGLWCTLLIALWIADEVAKDRFHKKGDRIGLVMTNIESEEGEISTWGQTGYPVAEALEEQIPEVEMAVRRSGPREAILRVDEKSMGADVVGADAGFFDLFSFPLKEGQVSKCLNGLKNIVLSEELEAIYFPNGNAVGKMVELMLDETSEPFLVTGVFKKIPGQSTLQFDAVVPIDNFLPMNNKSWGNTWMNTYLLQKENASLEAIGRKIKHLPEKAGDDTFRTLSVQPLEDNYLYSKFENGQAVGGNIDYVILFAIIALFTLLIACFNFINLTTAWAVKRSKEVGIKKVLGAGRGSLLGQFFTESVVLVVLSVGVAVLLAVLTMPMFNTITEKELSVDFTDGHLYGILGGIALATVLLSGLYPAFSLASFKGVTALNEKLKGNRGENLLRKSLVVFQFCLCMVMITGTLVVYLQLRFVQNKNLGIDRENIIYMPIDQETWLQSRTIKAELANYSGIQDVSSASSNFIDIGGTTSDPVWEGGNPQDGQKWFSILTVDFELTEMLDIPIREGRNFSPEFTTDTLNYLVNEEAVKAMGLQDPIGKSLSFWGDEGGKIVGVTDNFHFASLHHAIGPMIIRCRPTQTYLFYVKTAPGRTTDALAHMEEVHDKFSALPFTYHFLDEAIERGYKQEQKVQQLAGTFAVLAIIISCLGLFGLAMFTAHQRIREIAVRKVLGANVAGLFRLLSKDFMKLIAIAMLISLPFAWYLMNDWIQGFAYRIDIEWWMFALAGSILLGIALLTVSYQTIKVATTNPTKSLRME